MIKEKFINKKKNRRMMEKELLEKYIVLMENIKKLVKQHILEME